MSIQQFAHRVIEIFVVRGAGGLPALVQLLENCDIPSDTINQAEALIYSSFPFHTMSPCSANEQKAFQVALLDATAEQITNLVPMSVVEAKQFAGERILEYMHAMFDKEKDKFQVAEEGLRRLARLAFKNITGDQPLTLDAELMITGLFAANISADKGGAVLKKQYEFYEQFGDAEWVATMLKVLELSGSPELENTSRFGRVFFDIGAALLTLAIVALLSTIGNTGREMLDVSAATGIFLVPGLLCWYIGYRHDRDKSLRGELNWHGNWLLNQATQFIWIVWPGRKRK